MKKILISRTDGIGDLLLTTPLVRELKLSAGKPYVAVLASAYAGEILKNNPDVDEIITFDPKETRAIKKYIIEGKFDSTIVVYPRFGISNMLAHCRIPEIIGTAYRWYSPLLFTKQVKMHRKHSKKHEADYNLELAAGIIGEKTAEKIYYFVTPEEKEMAAEYADKRGLGRKFVIIHPGSGGSAWNISEAKYIDIADKIPRELKVLITGGPSEMPLIARIRDSMKEPEKAAVMEEPLSVREFAAVVGESGVLVSGSTGPMHIAAALGIKTLSFFPPDSITALRAGRWGPIGNIAEIIKPATEKLLPAAAMETISTDYIVDKIKQLMTR